MLLFNLNKPFFVHQRHTYGFSHPSSSFRPRSRGSFSFAPTYRGFSPQYRSSFQLPPRMPSSQYHSFPPASAPSSTSGASTSNNPIETPCQLCNKNGHSSLACRHRLNFAYQNVHTPHNMSAMLSTANILGENPWYDDSGANDHLTFDENELQLMSAYDGFEEIQTVNGEGMRITHIGSTVKTTSAHNFVLNDVLVVPQASNNLLLVHKFIKVHNCSITFNCSGFRVKDLSSGRVTLRGPQCNGLYPFKFQQSVSKQSSSTSSPTVLLASTTTSPTTANIWHRRLAHPSFQTLQHVFRQLSINNVLKSPLFCHDCQLGRSHKLHFFYFYFY